MKNNFYEIEINIKAPFTNGEATGSEEITYVWQTYTLDHIWLMFFNDDMRLISIDEEKNTCQIELSKAPENLAKITLEIDKEVHFQYANALRSGWVTLVLKKVDRKSNYELKDKELIIEEYVSDSLDPSKSFQRLYKMPIILDRNIRLENLERYVIVYRIADDGSVLVALTKKKGFGVLYKIMPNGGGYHKFFKSRDVHNNQYSRNVWLDFKIKDKFESEEEAE